MSSPPPVITSSSKSSLNSVTAEEDARQIRTLTTLLSRLDKQLDKPSKGPKDSNFAAATHIATLLSRREDVKDGKSNSRGPIFRPVAVAVTQNPKRISKAAGTAELKATFMKPSNSTLDELRGEIS